MVARPTTALIGASGQEAAAEIVGHPPDVKSLEGFKGVLVLANPETRVIRGMTLWSSAEAMERSEPVMKRIRDAETKSRDVVSQQSDMHRVAAFHLNDDESATLG